VTACESCGTQQDGDAYLCPACAAAARQQLAALPHLYRSLAEELVALGSNWPRGNGGHGTRSEAPMPLAEEPLVLRANGGMVSILESWRAALHDDRGWAPPRLAPGVEPRLHAAVKALTEQLPWIAASWPAAGDFAQEIADLYRSVTSITSPTERPGVRLGFCPAVYDGVECRAVLRVPPGATSITCRFCEAEYPARLWGWLRNVQAEMEQAS